MHAGLHTLRAQALRIGTHAHGHSLDVLSKDIPVTSSSLFGGNLGKAMVKSATAFRYKALGDCFVLSGLARPKPSRSLKQKASASPPFHGDSRHSKGQAPQTNRLRKRSQGSRGTGADHQAGKPKQPQWQRPKQGNKPKPKPNYKGEETFQHLTRGPSHESDM